MLPPLHASVSGLFSPPGQVVFLTVTIVYVPLWMIQVKPNNYPHHRCWFNSWFLFPTFRWLLWFSHQIWALIINWCPYVNDIILGCATCWNDQDWFVQTLGNKLAVALAFFALRSSVTSVRKQRRFRIDESIPFRTSLCIVRVNSIHDVQVASGNELRS